MAETPRHFPQIGGHGWQPSAVQPVAAPAPAGSPVQGYTVVMAYHDGSGIIGSWGPYVDEDAARAAIAWLKLLPIEEQAFHVVPWFGTMGQVTRPPVPTEQCR